MSLGKSSRTGWFCRGAAAITLATLCFGLTSIAIAGDTPSGQPPPAVAPATKPPQDPAKGPDKKTETYHIFEEYVPVANTQGKDPLEGLNPQNCGQACLYKKANEGNALQALYIEEKLKSLAELDRSSDPMDRAELRKQLSDSGVMREDNEDLHQWFERYKQLQIATLYKIRSATVVNDDSQAQLVTQKQGEDGRSMPSAVPIAAKAKKKAEGLPVEGGEQSAKADDQSVIPTVPRLADLNKYYKPANSVSKEQYKAQYTTWIGNLQLKAEDFQKTKTVKIEAKNSDNKDMLVIERKGSQGQVDKALFDKAQGQLSKIPANAQQNYQTLNRKFDQAYERHQKAAQRFKDDNLMTSVLTDSTTADSFFDSRSNIVNSVNGQMNDKFNKDKKNQGPKPASDGSAGADGASANGKRGPKQTVYEPVINPPKKEDGVVRDVSFEYTPDKMMQDIDKLVGP